MTLLAIIRDVCVAVGVQRPTVVVSSTDQTVLTLLRLAQEEGKALAKRHEWQALQVDHTFTSLAAEAQTGAVPSDFEKIVNDTFWNRSRRRPVKGPLSAQVWQSLKATTVPAVQDVFRVVGGVIQILPAPPAGETMAFTYLSKNWCRSEAPASTPQEAWQADTDAAILPDELHTLGIVWRFMASRGLEYAEAFRTYEGQVAQAISRDGGKGVLVLHDGAGDWRPGVGVPEGDWAI